MLKKVAIVVGLGLLLLLAAVVGVNRYLAGLVRDGLTERGSTALQVPVTVSNVTVRAWRGEVDVRGGVVGTPDGFQSAQTATFAHMHVRLQPRTLRAPCVIVEEAVLQSPEVWYELTDHGTNLEVLRKALRRKPAAAPDASGGAADSAGATPADTNTARRLRIADLVIRDGRLQVTGSLLNGKTVTVPLREIRLQNLGATGEGVTPEELAEQVVTAVAAAAIEAAAADPRLVDAIARGALQNTKSGLGKGASKLINALDRLFKPRSAPPAPEQP